MFVFVRAILSWWPQTWHIYIVYNILSLNISSIYIRMAAYKAVSLVVLVCALFASEVLSDPRPFSNSRPGGHKASYKPPGGRPDAPFDYSCKWFDYSLKYYFIDWYLCYKERLVLPLEILLSRYSTEAQVFLETNCWHKTKKCISICFIAYPHAICQLQKQVSRVVIGCIIIL